ncbi:MAG: 3-phosphoshikimate 1-carboxyvinyltransferase [Clostridia bacterium]|nr:3-phosphoshikimate 1-carboxyvinyltransferase [Clostridia bacterium]
MKLTFEKSTPRGTICAPPSKSMAHRMLISGGLSDGKSIVHGIAPSQDVLATLDCLESLGAKYTYQNDTVVIEGIGTSEGAKDTLKCRESGSTLRFFIPLCLLGNGKATLTGSETLLGRPLDVYKNICDKQNIKFINDGKKIRLDGKLQSGDFKIPGNISSQFISGLLFALPLLSGDSTINIVPPIESLSYINLTIEALGEFGVEAKWLDERTLYIKGSQQYHPQEVWVEGDYSNAAFFAAMDCLGGDVKITGLKEQSIQGDRVYTRLFEQLGKGTPAINISDCPDLGPVLLAVAAAKSGGVFTGTNRLRIKESDRGAAMAEELKKFGASVKVEDNTIVVYPIDFHKPNEVLFGHNDHRIVMSLCVLLMYTGGTIDGVEAVNKSMPDFFEKLKQLGVNFKNETV